MEAMMMPVEKLWVETELASEINDMQHLLISCARGTDCSDIVASSWEVRTKASCNELTIYSGCLQPDPMGKFQISSRHSVLSDKDSKVIGVTEKWASNLSVIVLEYANVAKNKGKNKR